MSKILKKNLFVLFVVGILCSGASVFASHILDIDKQITGLNKSLCDRLPEIAGDSFVQPKHFLVDHKISIIRKDFCDQAPRIRILINDLYTKLREVRGDERVVVGAFLRDLFMLFHLQTNKFIYNLEIELETKNKLLQILFDMYNDKNQFYDGTKKSLACLTTEGFIDIFAAETSQGSVESRSCAIGMMVLNLRRNVLNYIKTSEDVDKKEIEFFMETLALELVEEELPATWRSRIMSIMRLDSPVLKWAGYAIIIMGSTYILSEAIKEAIKYASENMTIKIDDDVLKLMDKSMKRLVKTTNKNVDKGLSAAKDVAVKGAWGTTFATILAFLAFK